MKHFYLLFLIFYFNNLIICAQATDYITNLYRPQAFCLNGTDLFFAEDLGRVSMIDVTDNVPITTLITNQINSPVALAVYGTDLYISDRGELNTVYDGKIYKMDLLSANSELIEIYSGPDIAYWVIFENYLFCSETSDGNIIKIDLTETNPVRTPVAHVNRRVFGLAIYGNDLYFSSKTLNTNNIFNISKIDITNNSASPIDVINSNVGYLNPLGLRTIGSNLYISDLSLDTIFKVDLTQNNLSLNVLVSDVNGVKDCIAYNNTLYIAEHDGNKISKLDNFDLGIEEYDLSNQISIYPNPVNNYLNISNLKNVVDFKIVNSIGQIDIKGKISPNETINVSELDQGMYLIILNNSTTKKFIKK